MACEIVCAGLIDVEPDRVPLIRTARQMGFGCPSLEQVTLVGDDPSLGRCLDFKMADPMPIRFSLPRVVKSIAKGIVVSLRTRPR